MHFPNDFHWHLCVEYWYYVPAWWASASLATTSNVSSGIILVDMWLCKFVFCDFWLYIVISHYVNQWWFSSPYHIGVLPYHSSCSLGQVKSCFRPVLLKLCVLPGTRVGMCPVNERHCYIVMTHLIDWAHTTYLDWSLVTCLNIIRVGVGAGAMKSLGRTLHKIELGHIWIMQKGMSWNFIIMLYIKAISRHFP